MTEFTKKQKKLMVKQLKRAKDNLWDGKEKYSKKERFVCLAILFSTAADDKACYSRLLRDEIARRLEYKTLITWLSHQGVNHYDMTVERLQAYRLAWINNMIEEFSQ